MVAGSAHQTVAVAWRAELPERPGYHTHFYDPGFFCLVKALVLPPNTWIIVNLPNYAVQNLLHRQILAMPFVRLGLALGNMHEEQKWSAGTPLDKIISQSGLVSSLLLMPVTQERALHHLDFL